MVLRPFTGAIFSSMRDSSHLCDLLENFILAEDQAFVSFGVRNLFGSVLAAEAAIRWLSEDPTLSYRTMSEVLKRLIRARWQDTPM